jgi:hypothetical protein
VKNKTSRNQVAALVALLAVACGGPQPKRSQDMAVSSGSPASVAAWGVVFGALQHPRCLSCHPAGDAPLQGDDSHPHAQNVQRGRDGQGLYALRCDACHQTQNLAGAHLPPGAPNWHLPRADMPLVFEGKSSGDLCRQLKDEKRNGGKTLEQLFAHVDHDPLVLWGWSPGEGRAPVSTSHADLVRAMRTWIDGGCGCP